MLFHVRMDVRLPHDMLDERAAELKRVEKARAAELQQAGTWRHLWRIAGQYSNISVFDVRDTDELRVAVVAAAVPIHAGRSDGAGAPSVGHPRGRPLKPRSQRFP